MSSGSYKQSRFGGKAQARESRFGGYGTSDSEVYLPGSSPFKAPPALKNLLKEHTQLKSHQTKIWLKKKVQFDKFKEPAPGEKDAQGDGSAGGAVGAPLVKKQYLMSTQEIKQNEIIEQIFTKFDSDGSGSLDINELVDLFKQNKVRLDKDVVKTMFQADEFTLQKFKAIINSDTDLQRFKDVFARERQRVLHEIHATDVFHEAICDPFLHKKMAKKFQEAEALAKQQRQAAPAGQGGGKGGQKSKAEAGTAEAETAGHSHAGHSHAGKAAAPGSTYVPATFETMMESFGVNLQRKTLQERFLKCYREAEGKFKVKEVSQTEILNMIAEAGQSMQKLLQISCAESSGLKNQHNQLFLSLMDRLEYLKQQEKEKEERSM